MKAKLCVVVVTALAIWGMKHHYSTASADALLWILTPTTKVVGVVTGAAFLSVPAEGYVSHERLFVIEKSCAGVNFMIAAFGMLVIALMPRVRTSPSGVCVLGISVLASYAAAILVNATRITIAMWLAQRPTMLPTLTAAEVHRLEGIVVYFAGLVLLYEAARRVERLAAPADLPS